MKTLGFAWEDNSTQSKMVNYIYQPITKETKEFIDSVANIEYTHRHSEKYYVINKLKFQIIENENN